MSTHFVVMQIFRVVGGKCNLVGTNPSRNPSSNAYPSSIIIYSVGSKDMS